MIFFLNDKNLYGKTSNSRKKLWNSSKKLKTQAKNSGSGGHSPLTCPQVVLNKKAWGIWLWKHPHLNSSAMLSHFGVFLTYIFPKGPKAFNVMLMVWLLPPFLHDPLFSTRFSCRKSRLCTSSPFVRARF